MLQAILTKAESQLLALSSEVPNCLIQVGPTCKQACIWGCRSFLAGAGLHCTAQHGNALVCQARGTQLGPRHFCTCLHRWCPRPQLPNPCLNVSYRRTWPQERWFGCGPHAGILCRCRWRSLPTRPLLLRRTTGTPSLHLAKTGEQLLVHLEYDLGVFGPHQ